MNLYIYKLEIDHREQNCERMPFQQRSSAPLRLSVFSDFSGQGGSSLPRAAVFTRVEDALPHLRAMFRELSEMEKAEGQGEQQQQQDVWLSEVNAEQPSRRPPSDRPTVISHNKGRIWLDVHCRSVATRRYVWEALLHEGDAVGLGETIQLSEANITELVDPCDLDVMELVGVRAQCLRGAVSASAVSFDPDRDPLLHKNTVNLSQDAPHRNHGTDEPASLDDFRDGWAGAKDEEEAVVLGKSTSRESSAATPPPATSSAGAQDGVGRGEGSNIEFGAEHTVNAALPPWCTFFSTRTMLVTFHEVVFSGLEEMQHLFLQQHCGSPLSRAAPAHGSSSTTYPERSSYQRKTEDLTAAGSFLRGATSPRARPMWSASRGSGMCGSTAGLVAQLVCFTSETIIADPTTLLSEVDCMDEMVLLIAPGDQDQPDLLRRVALLRRRISADRNSLYLKEKLLHSFMAPSIRAAIMPSVYDDHRIAEEVRQCLDKMTQVADRLDDARDTLNQANLNFVTGVSMRMSQSSANMDFKMQILGQVATICLPLNLVASIFGMNCKVPFETDDYDTLVPFWTILGLMALWCIICSIPTIRSAIRGNRPTAIVPTE